MCLTLSASSIFIYRVSASMKMGPFRFNCIATSCRSDSVIRFTTLSIFSRFAFGPSTERTTVTVSSFAFCALRSRGAVAEWGEFNGKLTRVGEFRFISWNRIDFFSSRSSQEFCRTHSRVASNLFYPQSAHFFSPRLFVIFFSIPWLLSKCVRMNGVPFNERHCGVQVSQP